MSSIAVFCLRNANGELYHKAFTNHGVACDNAVALRGEWTVESIYVVGLEQVVWEEVQSVFVFVNGGTPTVHAIPVEGAQELALCRLEYIEPSASVPRLLRFSTGKKLNLVASTSLDVSARGFYTTSKVVLPESSWTLQKPTYVWSLVPTHGEVVSHAVPYNKRFPAPSLPVFKKWAWSALPANAYVACIDASERGAYIAVSLDGVWHVVGMQKGDSNWVVSLYRDAGVQYDLANGQVRFMTVLWRLLRSEGFNWEFSYHGLDTWFIHCRALEEYPMSVRHVFTRVNATGVNTSTIVLRAFMEGFLTAWRHGRYNLTAYRLERERAWLLEEHYSSEFLKELSEEFSRINKQVDKRLEDLAELL